ncbi:hypothetical protein HWV62_36739 [Athelia sp. TMB]|nr:hypothetical protein HWV62_36739 [Athelia sp. TMB]
MSLTTKKKANVPVKTPKGKLSESRDLISTGRKDITASKRHGKRDENGNKPTTSKALVIRNGKYGAHGSGEVILASKMSGREKLDLLAESYTENAKKAIARPFKLEECTNIADSQYNDRRNELSLLCAFPITKACLDEILSLRDQDVFLNKILTEARARSPIKDGKHVTPNLTDSKLMATIVANRVHNAYMLASAWSIILGTLGELKLDGLGDRTAQADLKKNEDLRARYLVLYDMVCKLAEIGQQKFAVLATTAPHYAQYFRPAAGTDPDEPDQVFDRDALKAACKSFLDSIVLELAFPEAPYPTAVLYQILHEAADESPRETKRFPQELWDAVGDLSVTVQLQELLEGPLLGPGAAGWKEQPREMPEEYEKWVDAQMYSEEAAKHVENYQDVIKPITKTKQKAVLDTMWKCINANYVSVSGEDIDTLWQLDGALERAPQWHSVHIPLEEDEDSDGPVGSMALTKGGRKKKKKLLELTNGDDDDSHGSMPDLQSVSDSSDSQELSDSDEDSEEDSGDEDSDVGYDTDEEDELREMIREGMDAAMENPEFFDPRRDKKEFQDFYDLAEERKGNPFLKLLGSLRGRAFKSSPKLKTKTERTVPRKGFRFGRPVPTGPPPKVTKQPGAAATPATKAETNASKKATVEEVEDEDAAPDGGKKKKKKKKSKKKKGGSLADDLASLGLDEQVSPPTSPILANTPSAPSSPPASPPSKKQAPRSPSSHARLPSFGSSTTTLTGPGASSISLPIGQTVAQSGHSYSKEIEVKEKVKSRPAHGTMLSGFTERVSGVFSKFKRKDKHEEEPPSRADKAAWFANLPKRSNKLMHQLLNTSESDTLGKAPMKWDKFLQVMKDMGFTYVPSTAGSSVRFDPPSSSDPPVTFHKPHPDSTIHPIMLREFGKKLMDYYGWEREDLMRATTR